MGFAFLPTNRKEMQYKGWSEADIILVSGDAYVDHPSFGPAMVGRLLEAAGFRVGIIPQPDWRKDADFLLLGKPRLFFGITAGNLDSLIANRSAEKRPRSRDEFSEGGRPGRRPDRAVLVYANKLRQLYPDTPQVLGGLEASLRRIAHYDYWSDTVRRSILFDTRAEILVYGMAEGVLENLALKLQAGQSIDEIPQTARVLTQPPSGKYLLLPSYEEVAASKERYLKSVLWYEQEMAKKQPRPVWQACQGRWVRLNPPHLGSEPELDRAFALPFTRLPHPRYSSPIPAYDFVRFSLVSHRGCSGGCSFCTLTLHQGKYLVNRSEASLLQEVRETLVKDPAFKGRILDLGGPSANMYGHACKREKGGKRLSGLVPEICPAYDRASGRLMQLMRRLRLVPGVKSLSLGSGIRHDLVLADPEYLAEICRFHVGGQLSAAPEHCSRHVLSLMQKPDWSIWERFKQAFEDASRQAGKEQYLVPYFISAHPGTTLSDMLTLALYLSRQNWRVRQVQMFLPVPMTLSAAMYYCARDPFTERPLHVAKGRERLLQHALLQPWLKKNQALVREALQILNQEAEFRHLCQPHLTASSTKPPKQESFGGKKPCGPKRPKRYRHPNRKVSPG